jgi:hypothetical protein
VKTEESGEWQCPGHTIRLADKQAVPIIFLYMWGPEVLTMAIILTGKVTGCKHRGEDRTLHMKQTANQRSTLCSLCAKHMKRMYKVKVTYACLPEHFTSKTNEQTVIRRCGEMLASRSSLTFHRNVTDKVPYLLMINS